MKVFYGIFECTIIRIYIVNCARKVIVLLPNIIFCICSIEVNSQQHFRENKKAILKLYNITYKQQIDFIGETIDYHAWSNDNHITLVTLTLGTNESLFYVARKLIFCKFESDLRSIGNLTCTYFNLINFKWNDDIAS